MKKIIYFIVLLFALNSCGTDYFYSSFTIRRELFWFTTLADQETLDTRAQITGATTTFNRFSSPSIIATPANYLVAIYENRTTSGGTDLDIYGINGRKSTEVTARISKDSSSFNSTVTVGNTKGFDPTVAHGSPVSFLAKDGSIVVLSTGGAGFAQNYPSQKTKLAVSISTNNGYNWTDWSDLDEKIFEPLTKDTYDRFYTTPGNGTTLKDGTLVCMIDYKRDADASAQGAAILYSKDSGKTWQLGGTLKYNGNGNRFAKIIAERTDGKLLIAAVKDTGKNVIGVYNQNNVGSIAWYLADTLDSNITFFSDVTSPVVQDPVLGQVRLFDRNNGGVISGDRIKYSYKGMSLDGILLVHSYPEHKFKEAVESTVYNVTALSISSDDGKTWTMVTNVVGKEGTNKTSFRHSGLVVFRDGSIGIAYEEGIGPTFKDREGFIPYYRRFGLSAISGGVYSYEGI